MPTTMIDQNVDQAIANWPKEQQESARRLVDTYGAPDEVTPSFLIWFEKAKPWKRTVLSKEAAKHEFPTSHTDFVEQTINYRVPVDKISELGWYDGSVLVDRTRGELSARCGGTSKNFLAINLAVDIIEGRRTADDARREYASIAKRFDEGDKDPLTQGFAFELPRFDTADRDVGVTAS